jgi:polyisoprenyl-teichoic acid--peptidoglycan teichoic acid transferase
MVTVLALAFVAGGVLGYEAKPLARLGARIYLRSKQGQWQGTASQKKQVSKALTPLSLDPDRSVNTLVMGSDSGSNPGETGWCRSDVMLLVCVQERDKRAVVVSIPRDTMVQIPGYGTQKINAAHAFAGPTGAIRCVKSFLGIDVNHYVELNFDGFQKMINALGGVRVHIAKAINDPHAGYVAAGDQVLDGWRSLVVVRSRRLLDGDIDRITNQQLFIKALIDKVKSEQSVWTGKKLLDIFASTCNSDYTADQVLTLSEELRGFSPDNVQFVTLPGIQQYVDGLSYFLASRGQVTRMVTEIADSTWISPATLASLTHESSYQGDVQEEADPTADVVSVLSPPDDGTSNASTISDELKLLGHKTVRQEQGEESPEETVIYFRQEAQKNCAALLRQVPELRQASIRVNDEIPATYNAPIVIALGTSFRTPDLVAVYGRLIEKAAGAATLGAKVSSFN